MTEADVTAVIVSYNARDHLLRAIRSLRADGVNQIVVVDNASRDGSPAAVREHEPDVRVVETGRNLGYGAAANRGVAEATTPYALVMNADVEVEPGTVKALVAAVESDDRIAAAGPQIATATGELYPSARTFPPITDALGHAFLGLVWPRNPWSRRYQMLDWDHEDRRAVDWVSGACFLVRRTAFDDVGGFDPAFFMYSEDVDLFWRLTRAGWCAVYEPAGRIVHQQGVSAAHHPYRMAVAHHVSLLRFAVRSTRGWRRALIPAVAAGLALRGALVIVERAWARRGLR